MNTIGRFALLLLFLVGLFSCDEDSENPDTNAADLSDNSFIYDSITYEINDMVLRYHGPVDLSYHDSVPESTHHVFDLFFTDGSVEFECPSGCHAFGTEATYFVAVRFATAMNQHTDEFPEQTFRSILPEDYHSGNSPTDSDFYTTFFFRIDEGDQQFNASDIFVDGSDGTISFEKSGDEYLVNIDANDTDTTNNLTIKGSYYGTIRRRSL